MKLNAILPVILQKVEIKLSQNNGNNSNNRLSVDKKKPKKLLKKTSASKTLDSTSYNESNNSTLDKVEKLQWHLMVSRTFS